MNLSDITIEKLIEYITIDKKYRPGDRLPNEQELASELGVSRNTIRTAVRYLVGQGVLEIKIGRGTYVAEKSNITNDYGFDKLQVAHLKLRDLYEVRLILEPTLAYYAATRATDEELDGIIQLGSHLQKYARSSHDDSEGNELFHLAIVRAAHNEFGVRLWSTLNTALQQAFQDCKITQSITDFYMDHELIMYYLKRRDPDGAKLAMDLHLKNSMKFYRL